MAQYNTRIQGGIMSETAAEPAAETAEDLESVEETETESEGTEAAESTDVAAELERWKAESRKWEKRSKENSRAADKLREIEQANMSELEKAQAAQRDAEERATQALAMHNRVMAAAANDLPMELIDYLGSGTEEEIAETAQVFASVIEAEVTRRLEEMTAGMAGRNGQPPSGARPVESMRPGSAPASAGTATSPDEWFRQLLDNR